MANCTPDNDISIANDAPAGSGNTKDAQAEPLDREQAEQLRAAAERTDKELAINQLQTATDNSTVPPVMPPTKGEEKLARTIGKRAMHFLGLGQEGQQALYDKIEATRRWIEGATTQAATFWMNLKNWANVKFVDENANLLHFFDLFLHEPGKRNYEQTGFQLANQTRPRIRGLHGVYQSRQHALEEFVAPLASRSGDMYTTNEILTVGGEYAQCLHALERNPWLLDKWQEQIDANTARANLDTSLIQLQKYRDQIKSLDRKIKRKQGRLDAETDQTARARIQAEIDALNQQRPALETQANDLANYINNPEATGKEYKIKALRKERNSLKREATQLAKQIQELTDNLENPNPPEGLVRGGYTNAEARARMAEIEEKFKFISPDEWRDISKRLSQEFDFLTEELAKAGLVTPEQLATIPEFEWHVPQTTRQKNIDGASNDARFYTAMSVYAAEGTRQAPDSAWISLGYAARRTATAIGAQDLGLYLAEAARKFEKIQAANPDYQSPLKTYNEADLQRMLSRGTREEQNMALAIRNNNGIVVDVPIETESGAKTFERRYIYFDPTWSSGTLTGGALNQAISSNYKLGSKPVEYLAKATSLYGQSFTRFQLGFAPVAGFRDFTERLIHIANRDYRAGNGENVSGASLVGSYAANFARLGMTLWRAMRGKLAADSEGARLFDEFRRMGLMQKFTHSIGRAPQGLDEIVNGGKTTGRLREWALDAPADWLDGKNFSAWRRIFNKSGSLGQKALRMIDGWNDYFQNMPSFAHYVTLRKAGVGVREAAAHTLEIMDMTKQGTITKNLAVIAPFVRPTMQGAAAFAKTMGFSGRNVHEIFEHGKRGWLAGLTAAAGFGLVLPLVKDSLGYDEKGNSRFDAMPISRATTNLPIGVDDEGNYLKLPVGFGPVRTAYALTLAMDRMSRGILDPGEAAFEVLYAAARDTVPGNNPMFSFKDKPFEFITQYFCPAPLKPFLEVAENTDAFGNAIYNDARSLDKAMSDQGKKGTPAVWHRAAREIYKDYGVDLAPESLMHMAKGLALGPLRMLTTTMVGWLEDGEPYKGMQQPSALRAMPPWLAALGGTLYYAKGRDPAMQYYYEASRALLDKAKRAGVDLTKEGKKGEEGNAIVMQKLLDAGLDTADAEDIVRLQDIRKRLTGRGAAFSKKYKYWYDMPDAEDMKMDLERLFEEDAVDYNDFLVNSNYYSAR